MGQGKIQQFAIEVRKAQIEDVASIVKIGQGVSEFDTNTPGQQFYSDEMLSGLISGDNGVVFVATHKGEIVGFRIGHYDKSSQLGFFNGLFVAPGMREYGLANRLMEAAIQEYKHRGCRVLLAFVKEGNEPAIHVLQSCGFSIGSKFHFCDLQLSLSCDTIEQSNQADPQEGS